MKPKIGDGVRSSRGGALWILHRRTSDPVMICPRFSCGMADVIFLDSFLISFFCILLRYSDDDCRSPEDAPFLCFRGGILSAHFPIFSLSIPLYPFVPSPPPSPLFRFLARLRQWRITRKLWPPRPGFNEAGLSPKEWRAGKALACARIKAGACLLRLQLLGGEERKKSGVGPKWAQGPCRHANEKKPPETRGPIKDLCVRARTHWLTSASEGIKEATSLGTRFS